jgi:predicted acylesterase/phospholipase RssA
MGADVCLTVNAVPQLRRGVETVLTRAYRRLKLLDPLSHLAGTQGMPNMIDLVMSTMQTLQHELGDFKAISADVRMNPDLSDLTWIEFYRPQDFIERGVRAAERAIPQIHRVLAERLERAITSSLNTSARAVESRS